MGTKKKEEQKENEKLSRYFAYSFLIVLLLSWIYDDDPMEDISHYYNMNDHVGRFFAHLSQGLGEEMGFQYVLFPAIGIEKAGASQILTEHGLTYASRVLGESDFGKEGSNGAALVKKTSRESNVCVIWFNHAQSKEDYWKILSNTESLSTRFLVMHELGHCLSSRHPFYRDFLKSESDMRADLQRVLSYTNKMLDRFGVDQVGGLREIHSRLLLEAHADVFGFAYLVYHEQWDAAQVANYIQTKRKKGVLARFGFRYWTQPAIQEAYKRRNEIGRFDTVTDFVYDVLKSLPDAYSAEMVTNLVAMNLHAMGKVADSDVHDVSRVLKGYQAVNQYVPDYWALNNWRSLVY